MRAYTWRQFFAAITGSMPLPAFMNPENIGRMSPPRCGRTIGPIVAASGVGA